MNKSIKILFTVVLLFASTALFAQVKIGHINSSELLQAMPEVKQADIQLQSFAKQLQDKEKELYSEYQRKVAILQQDTTTAESIKEDRYNELMDMQARIEKFQETAQRDLANQKEKLYKPILEKAEKAIKDVAKEKGYKYILDTSMGNVLYFEESDDVMALVKGKLNI